jgi:hypothetical protein
MVTTAVSTRVLPGVVDEAAVAVGRADAVAIGDEVAVGVPVRTRVSVEAAAGELGADGANEADDKLQPATKTTVLKTTLIVRPFLPRIAYPSWDLWTS